MDKEIFRQKSIDRLQSPDNLKEYIKVVNPSLWIVFIAAFLLLAGAFVWGAIGRIEEKIPISAVSMNGTVICDYTEQVKTGMKVVINKNEGIVTAVSPYGISASFEETVPDGVYAGYVVVGEFSPLSFVFN